MKNQLHCNQMSTGPILFVGRGERLRDGQLRYAWSGAGIVARFFGTGATLHLWDHENEHQVIIDGRSCGKVVTERGRSHYNAISGLAAGAHLLEVYRRTEPCFGVTQFLGISIAEGELLPVAPYRRIRLEIVGDSISCGYGNEGRAPSEPFSASTENHYECYGAMLARALDAEVSTIAWSGRGVVRNYDGQRGETIPELYRRVIPDEPRLLHEEKAGFDAVLVNLGTNDFSTEPHPDLSHFIDAYVALLAQIRKNSPQAQILCIISPMLEGAALLIAEDAIANAVKRRQLLGDRSVSLLRLRIPNDAPGCDFHPSVLTHKRLSSAILPTLSALLGSASG
jgi:lysophospholipase L1-like esterase